MKTLFILITVTLTASLSESVLAQNINTAEYFPNPEFRRAVEQFMGIDPGGEFTAVEAAAKTGTLDCSGGTISDMTGIEYFTSITGLDCSQNELTSLNVSHNIAIERLVCRGNRLTTLDVSDNIALTELWCDYNRLASLDLSNNRSLRKLHCTANQLSSLNVSKNTALSELSCSDNRLDDLDVSANTALDWLMCGENQLTTISSFLANSGLDAGEAIDVRNNNLDCGDWHDISAFRARIGDPVFDGSQLLSGFAFSPQNGIDPYDCDVEGGVPLVELYKLVEEYKVLTLAPGLHILDAYEEPVSWATDIQTGQTVSYISPLAQSVITEDIFLNSGYIKDDKTGVYLYEFGRGLGLLVWAPTGPTEIIDEMSHVALVNRNLLIRVAYSIPQQESKTVIARITGDWESLGFDIPDGTPSADLNRDGKVDAKDLMLLQAQWNP